MAASRKALLIELLESSDDDSSSNSSDNENFMQMLYHTKICTKIKRPKIENYVEVVHQYTNKEFQRKFWLSRTSADMLITKYQESGFMPQNSTGGTAACSAELSILAFLRYACSLAGIRDIAGQCGIGESTLFKVNQRVMKFLVTVVGPTVIQFPKNTEDKEVVVEGFKAVAGFPDTLGAIDGTRINMKLPANKIGDVSVTLQAICDHKGRFLDAFTGRSSRSHDALVFGSSFIAKDLPQICEHMHVIGDAAYPLREYLLVPFQDYGNLTDEQTEYNKKICQTHVLIKNAFRILKGRFKRLTYVEMKSVLSVSYFVLSCCVIHNICIDNNDEVFEDKDCIDDPPTRPYAEPCVDVKRKLGEAKRNLIMAQLKNESS